MPLKACVLKCVVISNTITGTVLATTCQGGSHRNCSWNRRNSRHQGRRDKDSINVIRLTLLNNKGKVVRKSSILYAEHAAVAFIMSPFVVLFKKIVFVTGFTLA